MSSTLVAILPTYMRRKWDAIAIAQVCAELLHQDAENERLRLRDGDADYWHEQAMALQSQFAESIGGDCGITQAGDLVVLPSSNFPPTVFPPSTAEAARAVDSAQRAPFPSSSLDGTAPDLDNCTAAHALTADEHY